ncbi:hypothetical protein ACIBG8_19390 [Nonomuraea sp. NPDC050556]|uniref:hypothetical protein n=1 Tax=Nonomuraea sp. NPDC050556 TaxID=3364369 RepID=UPI0037B179D2
MGSLMTDLRVTYYDGERPVVRDGFERLIKVEREISHLDLPGRQVFAAELTYGGLRGFGVLHKPNGSTPTLVIHAERSHAERHFQITGCSVLNQIDLSAVTHRLVNPYVDVRVVVIGREDGDFEGYVTFTDHHQRHSFEAVESAVHAQEVFDQKGRYGLMVTRWRYEE